MKLSKLIALFSMTLIAGLAYGQEEESEERKGGHINNNKFRQMYQEFSSPNMFRSASGAPGPAYYQQQADYVMDIELEMETNCDRSDKKERNQLRAVPRTP